MKKALLALPLILGLTACSQAIPSASQDTSTPMVSGGASVGLVSPKPTLVTNYFQKAGEPVFSSACESLTPGDYLYEGVKANGQVGTACAHVNLPTTAERVDPAEDPAGYKGNNKRVSIPYLDSNDSYNGWFYNRSHLVSASMGGSPLAENLVTGTRMQNVGEGNKGGMRYLEEKVEDYLRDGKAPSCPVLYSATPVYKTSEDIVPSWVDVSVRSCDNSLSERALVLNTANGFTIDYATGIFKEM